MVRPLAVLIAVLLIFAAAVPASASATLLPLVLSKTNPASPSSFSLPRIIGEAEEGGGTKAVRLLGSSGLIGPHTRGFGEPANTVTIYTDSECKGAIAAEGTVAILEGEGIQVSGPVASDAITTFYAIQSNGSDTSKCTSRGLRYRQVSTVPAAPVFSSVSPASPADDNSPLLIGSADPEAAVLIYPTSSCTGSPFSGAGAEFAGSGIQVSVADNSETTFSAIAVLAGFSSPCSAEPIVYREVTPTGTGGSSSSGGSGGTGGGGSGGATGGGGGGATGSPGTPPQAPHIHTVPGRTSNDTTPLVTGSAPGAATVKVYASGDCSGPAVATGSASQFTSSGFQVQVIENAVVVFSAVAISDGGRSSCSSSVQYVEDSTPPHSRITMGPAAKTRHRTVVFRFTDTTGDAPGTAFFCKVDKRKWRACSSPLRLRGLHLTKHTVAVKATDPAGNAETTPAKRSFKVVAAS